MAHPRRTRLHRDCYHVYRRPCVGSMERDTRFWRARALDAHQWRCTLRNGRRYVALNEQILQGATMEGVLDDYRCGSVAFALARTRSYHRVFACLKARVKIERVRHMTKAEYSYERRTAERPTRFPVDNLCGWILRALEVCYPNPVSVGVIRKKMNNIPTEKELNRCLNILVKGDHVRKVGDEYRIWAKGYLVLEKGGWDAAPLWTRPKPFKIQCPKCKGSDTDYRPTSDERVLAAACRPCGIRWKYRLKEGERV